MGKKIGCLTQVGLIEIEFTERGEHTRHIERGVGGICFQKLMLMSRRVNGKAIVGLGVGGRFELQTKLSERILSDKVGIISSDKLLPRGRRKELDVSQRKRLQHEPGEEDLRSFLAYRTHTHRDCFFL